MKSPRNNYPFTLDDIIPHLRKARITKHTHPRKAIACCPAHDDNNPSLSLSETPDGKLLWNCRAGCSQEAVYEKLKELVGMKPATAKPISEKQSTPTQPLTLSELARAKQLNSVKLHQWGVREEPDGKLAIHYLTRDGEVSAVQFRNALTGDNRFKWRSGDTVILYGLWRISEWDTTDTLYLTEGTTDCWSMWSADLPALGIPSASTWKPEWWDEVKDFHRIVLIPDTDSAGAKLVEKLFHTVPMELSSRVYVLRLPDGVKDVNELWVSVNADVERFREALGGCEIRAIAQYYRELHDCTIAQNEPDDEPLFVPLSELLARSEHSKLEYVPLLGRDGLIARGTITLIGAHPKAGKTTLLVHACREWVQQNLTVVYLTEDPKIIWEERAKQFPELEKLVLNRFTREHPERWVKEIRELAPDVVVVDTIRRFVPTKDENDSASVSVALAPLVDLQHHLPRTAIVLVHHTKKNLSTDGEITDIAGSHAYTAEVDAIFLLAPVRENKHQRVLTPVAGRFWSFTPEPLVLELSESGTEYRVLGTVAEVLPLSQAQNAKQKVLNAIKVLGEATADEVAEYLSASGEHIPKRTIQHHLAQLYDDGAIQRDGRGTRGDPHIYRVEDSCNRANAQPLNTLHDCANNPNPEPNLFTLPTDTVNNQSRNQPTEQAHDNANNTPRSGISRISRITIYDVNEPLQQFTVDSNPPTAMVYELPQPETTVDELHTALAIPELDNQPTQHNPASGELSNSTNPTAGGIEMMNRNNRNSTVDTDTLFRTALQVGFPRFTVVHNGNRLDVDGSYAGWKTALPTLAKENVMREAYLALNRCRTRKETQPIVMKMEPDSFSFSTTWRVEVVSIERIDDGKRLRWTFRTVDDNRTITAITKYSTEPDSKFARWITVLTREPNPPIDTLDLSQLVGKVADGVVVHKQSPDGDGEQLELFNLVRVKRYTPPTIAQAEPKSPPTEPQVGSEPQPETEQQPPSKQQLVLPEPFHHRNPLAWDLLDESFRDNHFYSELEQIRLLLAYAELHDYPELPVPDLNYTIRAGMGGWITAVKHFAGTPTIELLAQQLASRTNNATQHSHMGE